MIEIEHNDGKMNHNDNDDRGVGNDGQMVNHNHNDDGNINHNDNDDREVGNDGQMVNHNAGDNREVDYDGKVNNGDDNRVDKETAEDSSIDDK